MTRLRRLLRSGRERTSAQRTQLGKWAHLRVLVLSGVAPE